MTESVESLGSQVSPPMSGGTLGDLLAQQKQLNFSTVVDYLDQLSENIDLAHERGLIYRNLNPSIILFTSEGRLALPDFGLASGAKEQMRDRGDGGENISLDSRLFVNSWLKTLAYMAPEQILAGDILSPQARRLSGIVGMDRPIDGRVDLYSLGVVLYQMVTGRLPFQDETPEQVALKHLRMPPPSPRQLRPDLPAAAEQAMLRALAKRPADRYMRAQDLATAFRVALIVAEIVPTVNNDLEENQPTGPIPVVDAIPSSSPVDSKTPLFPVSSEIQETFSTVPISPISPIYSQPVPTSTGAQPTLLPSGYEPITPFPATNTTGMLALSNFQQGNTGTLKLTGPAKIVQVPVAGQPGLYVTGLLSVFPQISPPSGTLPSMPITKSSRNKRIAILALIVMVMLVVFSSGIFWFISTHSSQTSRQIVATVIPDPKATASAIATATAGANIILVDPLSQNTHNWPVATTGSMIYIFENNAYHIMDNDSKQGAPAILPDESLSVSFAYTLTMEEIKGDDTSVNNEFGMIIRASSQNKNGRMITTFYSFEVLNTKGGEYQFWKYDNSLGPTVSPWTKLWHHPFGGEFHQGHGHGSVNTFKIFVNGKSFTLIVNGKQITTVQDSSCKGCPCICSGGVGMLVNLKGTEVAFSNLRLTYS